MVKGYKRDLVEGVAIYCNASNNEDPKHLADWCEAEGLDVEIGQTIYKNTILALVKPVGFDEQDTSQIRMYEDVVLKGKGAIQNYQIQRIMSSIARTRLVPVEDFMTIISYYEEGVSYKYLQEDWVSSVNEKIELMAKIEKFAVEHIDNVPNPEDCKSLADMVKTYYSWLITSKN